MVEYEKLGEALEKGDVVFLTASSDSLVEMRPMILEDFDSREDYSVIYVTVARPCNVLEREIEEKGGNPKNIFFIDCMSKESQEENAVRKQNRVFLEPGNLSNISIAISEAVENLSGKKLVVLDTLSALAIYNDEEALSQFGHFLSGKIRNWGIKSLLVALDEDSTTSMASQISQSCDCSVTIKN